MYEYIYNSKFSLAFTVALMQLFLLSFMATKAEAFKAGAWATINICDTEKHPNAVGIRASMNGSGEPGVMYMRFEMEYRNAKKHWKSLGSGARTKFVRVGSAKSKRREAGWTFKFKPPKDSFYLLRGLVTFRWVQSGKVVRELQRKTTSGHSGTASADPKNYSAATCKII